MQQVFDDDFDSTIKEGSLSFMNTQLELAIKLNLKEDNLANNFSFKGHGTNQSKQQKYFGAFNMSDVVWLQYANNYPLDLVISEQCLNKYNQVFFFVIKIKRLQQILGDLWKKLNGNRIYRNQLDKSLYQKMRPIQLLRSKMQAFVDMLD